MLSLRLARSLLIALAAAAIAATPVAVVRPFEVSAGTLDLGALGRAEIGVVGSLVPMFLLVLVTGIGAVVAAYSARNLVGQHRVRRFAALEVVAVLALASAVVAPSTVQVALGWTIGGLAIAGLVGHAGTPAARASSRLMASRLLVGDVALWSAVVVAGVALGTLDLSELDTAVAAASTWAVAVTALLLVVAGIARSALVPMHRWLPETSAGPSPVSALLHAGLVNGVGVLALLFWPVLMASGPVRGVLLVAAVATAVLGTAQVRTRPDVKGRLAASTTAQMGYLGVQVALGLPAAVLAHLIGHGLWKASLFLGAGGAVERARRSVAHPRAVAPRRTAQAVIAAVVVVAAAAFVPGPWGAPLLHGPAELLPVALAVVALAAALRSGVRLRTRAHGVALGASVLAVVLYVLGLRVLATATESTFAHATPAWGEPGAWAVGLLVAGIVAIGAAFWRFDARARAGQARRIVDAVARTSLPPAPVRHAMVGLPVVDADVLAAARVLPGAADVAEARAAIAVAADSVAPLFPLESFVASNPIASLETLEFHEAMSVAADAWGNPTGPSADLLRRALGAGRVDDAAIARAAADVAAGRAGTVAGVPLVDVVRETLLVESAAPHPCPRTGSPYVDLVLGRVYGATAWGPAPGGVWAAVRADAGLDQALRVRGARDVALALPADPEQAVAVLLGILDARQPAAALQAVEHALGQADASRSGAPQPVATPLDTARTLARLVTSNAGWAAHVAWRLRQGVPVPGVTAADPDDQRVRAFADLIVLRLLDAVLHDAAPALDAAHASAADVADVVAARLGLDPAAAHGDLVDVVAAVQQAGVERLRLQAWEHAVRAPIVDGIRTRAAALAATGMVSAPRLPGAGPDAQFVTCIDVRSERLRRRLEEAGPWETFGAAGFFGLPLRHVSPSGVVTERCPVLIRPDRTVTEQPRPSRWSWSTTEGGDALHAVEGRPFTPYALAEASGWLLGPLAALRTAAPAWWSRRTARLRAVAGEPTGGALATSAEPAGHAADGFGFEVDELVDLADGFLRSTGLVDLAPVVVLCGHGGSATNNPHLAAYDCGACGGQAGDVSARAMVQVLADPRVAAGLRERGIDVTGTTFVAALHDTTRDRVALLDATAEPGSTLARLVADLGVATDAVAHERRPLLPQAPGATSTARLRHHLDRRAGDWAQVRPEWGLAGNAAMVIGPRSLTVGDDLGGRVFLQSYRPDLDPEGALLESLMGGPLVVGQWINMQYWASTVDPDRFGAGDKTTHNVVVGAEGTEHALSGVLTGPRGDLRIGLPWQGVSASAPVAGQWRDLPFHDPVRLLGVVCARPEIVDAVLARQPHVATLVRGGWIALQVVDPDSGAVRQLDPVNGWVDVDAASPAAPRVPAAASEPVAALDQAS